MSLDIYWDIVSIGFERIMSPSWRMPAHGQSLFCLVSDQPLQTSESACLLICFRAVPFSATVASSPTSEIWIADSERWSLMYIKGLLVLRIGSFILHHQSFSVSFTFFLEVHSRQAQQRQIPVFPGLQLFESLIHHTEHHHTIPQRPPRSCYYSSTTLPRENSIHYIPILQRR